MLRRQFIHCLLLAGAAGLASRLQAAGSGVVDVVRDGIQRQRSLRIRYAGHMRLVDPHAIGVTAGGHRALLAWQVEGGSRSDPPTGWRTFLLSEIAEAAATVRGFTPQPTYSREKAGLRSIEVDVSANEQAPKN